VCRGRAVRARITGAWVIMTSLVRNVGSPGTKTCLWLVVGAGMCCPPTSLSAQVAVFGATLAESTVATGNHVVVTAVADSSPASYAGISIGDRIVGVARRPVHNTAEVQALAGEQAGPVLGVLIERDGVVTEALVPLQASAADLASPPRRVTRGCAVFCLAPAAGGQPKWDDCGCEGAVRRTCNGCAVGWRERLSMRVVRPGPGSALDQWRLRMRDGWCVPQ